MLTTTFTYEFVLDNDERIKGASLWTETGSEKEQPKFPGSRLECDLDNVDSVILSDGRVIKAFWAKNVFGPDGDPLLLMKEPCDLALILTFEGQTLIGRAEPTLDDKIGLSISNERNRVLFTGVGSLVEIYEPVQGYQLIANLQAVYNWRRSSPSGCAGMFPAIRKDRYPPKVETPDGGAK